MNDHHGITLRPLGRDEIDLIWTIDRSEVHENVYKLVDGELATTPFHFEFAGWPPGMIDADKPKLEAIFDRGGVFIGAFADLDLVGVGVLDTVRVGPRRDHLQLFYLYVSNAARGQGVGTRLLESAVASGRARGARALYISAIPTQNTVDFYLRRGARLIDVPDEALFAAEPEDIHLSLST